MKGTQRPPKALYVYWALLLLGGCAMIYFATADLGAGVGEDSAKYLSAAQSLAEGRGLLHYNGNLMTQWPPVYPALLAGLYLVTNVDVFVIGWWLNIVLFGLSIFLSGVLFARVFGENSFYTYAGPLFIWSSVALITPAVNVSSDVLFLVVVLLFLLQAARYVHSPSTRGLLGMGALVILLTYIRYAGFGLIIAGTLLVLTERKLSFRHLVKTAVFGLATSLPIAGWTYFHNYRGAERFVGYQPLLATPWQNFALIPEKVASWFLPSGLLAYIPPFLVIIGFGLVLLALSTSKSRQAFAHALWKPVVRPHALFLVGYVCVLVFASSYYELRYPALDRIHAILLPSLMIVTLLAVKHLPARLYMRVPAPRLWLAVICLLLLCFTGYRAQKYVRLTAERGDVHYNFANSRSLHESALARYLTETPGLIEGSLFSNNEAALWFYVRHEIRGVPRVGDLTTWPQGESGYLVWFLGHLDYKYDLIDPEDYERAGLLQIVFEDELGVVYRITAPND